MKKYLIFMLVLMLTLNTGCTITIGNPSSDKETSKKTDEDDEEETKEEKTTSKKKKQEKETTEEYTEEDTEVEKTASKKKKQTLTVKLDVPDGFEKEKDLAKNQLAGWSGNGGRIDVFAYEMVDPEIFEAITADGLRDSMTKNFINNNTYPDPYIEDIGFERDKTPEGYPVILYMSKVDVGAQFVQATFMINADRLYSIQYRMMGVEWDDTDVDNFMEMFWDSVSSIKLVEE